MLAVDWIERFSCGLKPNALNLELMFVVGIRVRGS